MIDYEKLAKDSWTYIKTYIEDQGITKAQITEGTGIPASTVRSWFNEIRPRPGAWSIQKLTDFIIRHDEAHPHEEISDEHESTP